MQSIMDAIDEKINQKLENLPKLSWDVGTAYDLFISLNALHNPEEYSLPASWAAGVRSRLPVAERKVVEDMTPLFWVPMCWIYTLPSPKDAASVLWALRQIPPRDRLSTFIRCHEEEEKEEFISIIKRVDERQAWDEKDLEALKAATRKWDLPDRLKKLPKMLDWVSRPAEFGDLILSALQSYHQSFFAEEEKRISPALQEGLEKAQALSENLPLHDLIVELSQGVHFEEPIKVKELILAPAYWATPLILYGKIDKDRMILLYGARPADASLVPGEQVPDALLRALKALADPTRLRILRFLTNEAMTQAELSRALRLRPPTVIHHLKELRLAGLVYLTLESEDKKRYAARLGSIPDTFSILKEFLPEDKKHC